MSRKIILIIFLITIGAAIISIIGRYNTEGSVNGVELIMDYDSLKLLDVDKDEYLSKLKENGLTAVAIYSDNLQGILNRGEGQLIRGNELKRVLTTTGKINPLLADYPYNKDSAFFVTYEDYCLDLLEEILPEWESKYNLRYEINGEQALIFFKKWDNKYLDLSLGFNEEIVGNIKNKGLKIIPRFLNNSLDNSLNWELMDRLSPSAVIFAGNEITGYQEDSKDGLNKTADLMGKNNIVFGMIEPFIARQKGADSLAYLMDFNLLRVHSIQQQEMDERANYDVDDIIDRYLRAVRERNVRLLYLKPFLKEKDNIPAEEYTLSYINNLSTEIKSAGYNPGTLQTYTKYKTHYIFLLITGLGISIAGMLLLDYILAFRISKYYYLFLPIVLLVELVLVYMGRELFLRKFLALASGVIFPSLAVITQLLAREGKSWLIRFLKACLISFLGAIFLAAALAHISFILYIDQFTGVKLSFIVPIFFISIYYFRNHYQISINSFLDKSFAFLEKEIKIKHVILFLLLAAGGMIYIARTGNNPIIPIPDIEVLARDLLEKLLYIRPRFKEFLIGHPFFMLSLGLAKKFRKSLLYFPLIILASIGQINILNTFSHIHTPFLVSVIRTFHGIWLGLVIGIIFLMLVRYFLKIWNKKRSQYYG